MISILIVPFPVDVLPTWSLVKAVVGSAPGFFLSAVEAKYLRGPQRETEDAVVSLYRELRDNLWEIARLGTVLPGDVPEIRLKPWQMRLWLCCV